MHARHELVFMEAITGRHELALYNRIYGVCFHMMLR